MRCSYETLENHASGTFVIYSITFLPVKIIGYPYEKVKDQSP